MAESLRPLFFPAGGEQAFHQALKRAARAYLADDHYYADGWYRHNFSTACDWQTTPSWVCYLTGGLNYHLPHHLFPGWSHRHYPALATIIEQLAVQHGMGYCCIGHRELLRQQQQFLREMGKNPTMDEVSEP